MSSSYRSFVIAFLAILVPQVVIVNRHLNAIRDDVAAIRAKVIP